MDRGLMSQKDLNHTGSFSSDQPHHFQLRHMPDRDQSSCFHNLVNEDRQVREKLFYKTLIRRCNDMISRSQHQPAQCVSIGNQLSWLVNKCVITALHCSIHGNTPGKVGLFLKRNPRNSF